MKALVPFFTYDIWYSKSQTVGQGISEAMLRPSESSQSSADMSAAETCVCTKIHKKSNRYRGDGSSIGNNGQKGKAMKQQGYDTSFVNCDIFFIACDDCDVWYNVAEDCVGFDEAAAPDAWSCVNCERKKRAKERDDRKKAAPSKRGKKKDQVPKTVEGRKAAPVERAGKKDIFNDSEETMGRGGCHFRLAKRILPTGEAA